MTWWLDRYEADGLAGLVAHRPSSGRPKQVTLADEEAIIARAGTMTHDYKRHGTTTLFAALDVPTRMLETEHRG